MKLLNITKAEVKFIVIVLVVLWTAAFFNLLNSLILARDVQRKNDLKHITTALDAYRKDVGKYPPQMDGKMQACLEGEQFKACSWGSDALESTTSAYIKPLPEDPFEHKNEGSYLYLSNIRDYQLFASLESREDDEFNQKIFERRLPCGNKVCNFGVGTIPPDKEL